MDLLRTLRKPKMILLLHHCENTLLELLFLRAILNAQVVNQSKEIILPCGNCHGKLSSLGRYQRRLSEFPL